MRPKIAGPLQLGRSRLGGNAGQEGRDGDQPPAGGHRRRGSPRCARPPRRRASRLPPRPTSSATSARPAQSSRPTQGQEDGADDVLGQIGGRLDRHRRQARSDPQSLAQGLALQAVAEGEVEAAPLDGVDEEGGGPGQPLQFVG